MKDPAADQSEAKFREQCRNELIPGCPHCLYKLPPFGKWVRAPAIGGLTGGRVRAYNADGLNAGQ